MIFKKFAGIQVLAWFLTHPNRRAHFKELCRELSLGPTTVKDYCEQFLAKGWLREERNANLRIFWLDNGLITVKAIKRAYFLDALNSMKLSGMAEGHYSLALYGSHASGEYDERSDVDLLFVGRPEQIDQRIVKKLERQLGKKIQITQIALDKWEKNKKSDPFMLSVMKNHVVLAGAQL